MKQGSRLTVLLSSKENFVWHSMQEIIPAIEKTWLNSAEPGHHEVLCFDVDRHPLSELLPHLIRADNIVLTCFTLKLARLARLLRNELKIDARLLIYLHNQASIACWPLHAFGLGEHLRTDDTFISSCRKDAETMVHSFDHCRVEIIPFSLLERTYPVAAPPAPNGRVPFVFVGRISVQKNLHPLLQAFRLLADRSPELRWDFELFGGEDHLGSPNMGMEFENYQAFLLELVSKLGLNDRVNFRGHLERQHLHSRLSKSKHVLVSPSLHADENFGMAAFRSLCYGNNAVLSHWGGHADFVEPFSDRLITVQVHGSAKGPFLDVQELTAALEQAAALYPKASPAGIPLPYQETVISDRLRSLALETSTPGLPLQMTRLAQEILARWKELHTESKRQCKIFRSYEDPACQPFFKGYGMGDPMERTPLPTARDTLQPVPWAEPSGHQWIVNDPHRGTMKGTLDEFHACGYAHDSGGTGS